MKTLDEIGLQYRTDKSSPYHNYLNTYEQYFDQYKNNHFTLLELGLGDKNSANREGESLFVWRDYFPNAHIIGVDNDPAKLYNGDRVTTFVCDQTDDITISYHLGFAKPFIIIDDASHIQSKTIASFEALFPILQPGGYYIIEDSITSYWSDWGGLSNVFGNHSLQPTIMGYMFDLCHIVNLKRQETFNPPQNFPLMTWEKQVESVSFHHSQIFIKKKI